MGGGGGGKKGQDKGKGVHENEFQKSTYVRDVTGVNRPRLDRVCDSEEGGGRVIPRGNTSRSHSQPDSLISYLNWHSKVP